MTSAKKNAGDKFANVYNALWYIERALLKEWVMNRGILTFILANIENPKLSELKAFLKKKKIRFTKDGKIEIPE